MPSHPAYIQPKNYPEVWVERHNTAVALPDRKERVILTIMDGISRYINNTHWDGEWFLDQYVADLLNGFRGLLNGPIGRLDAGTLDSWACEMLERVHHNPDTGERIN